MSKRFIQGKYLQAQGMRSRTLHLAEEPARLLAGHKTITQNAEGESSVISALQVDSHQISSESRMKKYVRPEC